MNLLPFLTNRQNGSLQNKRSSASNSKLNLDGILSKLVCCRDDVFPSYGQGQSFPPFACKFRKDRRLNLLAVANDEGEIVLLDTDKGKGLVKSFLAHNNAVFDICWINDENQLITGSGDHRALLWDMNTCKKIACYKGHTRSIKTLDVCPSQSAIFAAGSRDGNISIWDRRERTGENCDKPSILIVDAHNRKHTFGASSCRSHFCQSTALSSVSALAFQSDYNLASAGVADGFVKIWDLRKTYVIRKDRNHVPKYQLKFFDASIKGHGCTSIVFDSLYKKLYACSSEDKIYQFDCHSYSENAITYTGFKCKTYFVKMVLSSDDQYLLCGSSDNKAYIWNTAKPGLPILELPGHSTEVSCVEWSPNDATKLVTCGDDMKVLVWRSKGFDDIDPNYIFSSCSPYSKETKPIPNTDIISVFQCVTPFGRNKNTPKIKKLSFVEPAITTFFSPKTSLFDLSSTLERNDKLPPAPSLSKSLNILPQPRSPCKLIGENDANILNENTVSPKTSPAGKENSVEKPTVTDHIKQKGQVKRKLSEALDRICRFHPEGCGRTKGHTRCGKKIIITPDKWNIKNYFSVSPE